MIQRNHNNEGKHMKTGRKHNLLRWRRPSVSERFERFRHEHSLVFAAFVLALTALVVVNTLFMVHTLRREQNVQPVVYSRISTSLQLASNGALQAQVRNVATELSDDLFQVSDIQAVLIMDITIKNTTTRTQQFIPVNQLYVRSEDGTHSALHMSSHAPKPIPASELKPGQSVSGQLSFVIPRSAERPLLYIDTGWDNSTPLVVDVLR